MKKLVNLLAIPILTLESGCCLIHNDQVRIPSSHPIKYKVNGKEIKAFYNMFLNSNSGSHILIVRQEDGSKITYIGTGPTNNPKLDFIEDPKRRTISERPDRDILRKREYQTYIKELMKSKRINF